MQSHWCPREDQNGIVFFQTAHMAFFLYLSSKEYFFRLVIGDFESVSGSYTIVWLIAAIPQFHWDNIPLVELQLLQLTEDLLFPLYSILFLYLLPIKLSL